MENILFKKVNNVNKINLFICENFKKEFEKVIEKIDKYIQIIPFPSFCTYRDKEKEDVFFKNNLSNFNNSIVICGRFCEIRKNIPKEYKDKINFFYLDNCFYLFGKTKIDKYIKERAYIVTPNWLINWEYNLKRNGFTRENAIKFYNETFKKIVLLNTGIKDNIEERLIDFSKYIELPYVIDEVDLDYLELLVTSVIKERELEDKISEQKKKMQYLNTEKSNYLAALKFLSELSNEENEESIVKKLVDKFKILFSPKKIEFIYYNNKDILDGKDYEIISKNKGFIVKIKFKNEIYGYLKVEGFLFPQYFDSYLNFMIHIKDVIGLSIANAKKLNKIKKMAITDGLTGIYNRKYFNLKLLEEIKRFKRENKKFSLIMFDLDNFKEINDKFGHGFGDKVLKTVVESVKKRIRETDFFFRWGGDEFILLLPNTTLGKAKLLAKELKGIINGIDIGKLNGIDVSMGIVEYDGKDNIDTIFERLDKTMYKAKSRGKNTIFSEDEFDIETKK